MLVVRGSRFSSSQSKSGATHPDATAYLAYLTSAKAKPVFQAHGFTVLSAGRS